MLAAIPDPQARERIRQQNVKLKKAQEKKANANRLRKKKTKNIRTKMIALKGEIGNLRKRTEIPTTPEAVDFLNVSNFDPDVFSASEQKDAVVFLRSRQKSRREQGKKRKTDEATFETFADHFTQAIGRGSYCESVIKKIKADVKKYTFDATVIVNDQVSNIV
jgi:hypothetical protein